MPSCPYCQCKIQEKTPACPSCQLSLDAARKLLGPVPFLQEGLNAPDAILGKSDARRIRAALMDFGHRFPQSSFHVILREFSSDFPLSTHLFWLFNASELPQRNQKHGKNRDLLLGIDPAAGNIAIIVGYGLEPFLQKQAIDRVLEVSKPELEKGNFREGIITVIKGMRKLLDATLEEIPRTFGLPGYIDEQPASTNY